MLELKSIHYGIGTNEQTLTSVGDADDHVSQRVPWRSDRLDARHDLAVLLDEVDLRSDRREILAGGLDKQVA